MTELAIDTHRFVKQLMESGFTEAQAETLADAQMQLLAGRMATKDDIQELHSRIDALHGRIDAFEASVDARFNALEASVDARFNALEASVDAKLGALRSELRSEFAVLLIRSQIATGAAIITILSFINYLTG